MPKSKLFIVPKETAWRERVPNNLPVPPSRLLGREEDVDTICRLLADPDVRQLTLSGPGGVGKTRLALEVAEMMLDEFEHGVFFVDLAVVSDPAMMIPAIASALQVGEEPGKPLVSALKEHLQDKKILLVLDNVEQIAPAASALPDLLANCPDLKLLITSRAALGLRAGRDLPVSPLTLPPPGQHLAAVELGQYGAVALFVQRASGIDAGFQLTGDNAGAVVEICRRVDGLPLAIELVTAYLGLLSPRSLLARLTHPLHLLTAGSTESPDRHRTMRDTIAWSYGLLTEQEQRLFRRLSVFVGSFSQRGAEAVCNKAGDTAIEPDHPQAIEVLEGMRSLVSKSLVRRIEQEDGEDPRLGMLETVREYALEQLVDSGEAEALRQCHADYYLGLAEQIESSTKGPELTASLARLVAEQDNLRAALQRLLEREEPAGSEDALRLIRALIDFWDKRTHVSELRRWLERALAQAGPDPTPLRAWGLGWACTMARRQGDYQRARAFGEVALAIARELANPVEIARALNAVGGVALYQGDYQTAGALSGEALIKYREAGADTEVAGTLSNLGLGATYKGDYDRAEEFYRESVDLLYKIGNKAGALNALTNLGYAALYQGDWRRAKAIFVETLTLTLEIDSERPSARVLAGLAGTILAEVGLQPRTAPQDLRRAVYATQLLGISEARRERGGVNFDPLGQAEFERNVATARKLLGEEVFNRAWEEGGTLTLDQALELATRDYTHEDERKPRGRGRPKKRVAGGLTDREYDVAALLARGMTNSEIAGQLVLSVRTVEAHVANAMQKLGLHTRTELAAWAVREGVVPHPARE